MFLAQIAVIRQEQRAGIWSRSKFAFVLTFVSPSEKRVNRGQTVGNPILDNSMKRTSTAS
jgi:hypothetical protein